MSQSHSPFVCCRCADSLIGGAIVWSVKDRRYAHTACLAAARRAADRLAADRARRATDRPAAARRAADESPDTAAIRAAMRRAAQ